MPEPLKGMRVIDITVGLMGPTAAVYLSDMGAEVMRVEEPEGAGDRRWGLLGPDGETLSYKIVGRSRKGISLRLNTEEGMKIFRELVKRSDAVLHNFTPGTKLAEELSYEQLREINPRIIVAGISGFGQNGPDAKLVCFDHNAQARSGGMILTGFPGDPPLKTTITYNDISAGQCAALGIALALYHREKTGLGQAVDVSLFDMAVFATQCMSALLLYQVYGEIRKQVANRGFHSYIGVFEAKDDWVLVTGTTNPIWRRLTKAIGREDLATDPRFAENDMVRFDNADLIDEVLKEWVGQRMADEVLSIFQEARVPCSRVNTIDKLLEDQQVQARHMIDYIKYGELGNLAVPGIPLKLSLTPGFMSAPAPKIGEHNKEIYSRLLGFSAEELSRLRQEDII